MGLDGVEFIIAIEEAFGLDIPNEVAVNLRTPRDVVDYLVSQLPVAVDGPCLSQRAFYRLRTALEDSAAGESGLLISPDSELDRLVPRAERDDAWHRLGTHLGASSFPGPPVASDWLARLAWWRPRQVRDVVQHVVAHAPRSLIGDDGWTRAQISAVVTRLCEVEFGVDMRRFSLDSEFVRDMGID